MTRTQYYVAASLDGYIADAQGRLEWLFQFNDAEGVMEHYNGFLAGIGAIAMGARTYEFLLGEGKEWPYPGLPTWVFTHRRLPAFPGADVRFTSEDVRAVHARMVEAAGGKNIWMVGGGELAAQFAAHGLIDELHLCVVPVFLRTGAPLLAAALHTPLELVGMKRFGQGLVELRYAFPAGSRAVSQPPPEAGGAHVPSAER